VAILAVFTVLAQNLYLRASGTNPDISVQFLDPNFLIGSKIVAISGRLPSIFHQKS